MLLNKRTKPCVIIAGSGMINGGRILKHLQFHVENPKNTLLIVGYQAAGTLGRQILDGGKQIYIGEKNYLVNAEVEVINEFSAHADKPILKEWLTSILHSDKQPILPTKIFLTHGEKDQALPFKAEVEHHFMDKVAVSYPGIGEKVEIW
jgi:metallo-beta-lactamase family protein